MQFRIVWDVEKILEHFLFLRQKENEKYNKNKNFLGVCCNF